jgi:hypothetical protein
MKEKDVERFEKVEAQLGGLYEEVQALAKKNPDDAINTFKLRYINSVLQAANALLSAKQKPFEDFSHFDEQ